jgi:hypothetical protein
VDEAHAEAEDVRARAAEALKGTASVVGAERFPTSYLSPPRLLANVLRDGPRSLPYGGLDRSTAVLSILSVTVRCL